MIKDENFILIQGWMISKLNLKGNDLLIYAIIYGFTQDGQTRFNGGLSYLAQWTNSTKQGVINSLKSLYDKGLIDKQETFKNGLKFVEWWSKKFNGGSQKNLMGGQNFLPNNINNNILNNINNNNDDEDEELKEVFQIWLDYKKEKKQTYKPMGEKIAFNRLKKYSNNDIFLAKQIIEDAMAKNYAGFFPLKQTTQTQTQNLGFAKQEKMVLIEEGRFYIDDTMEEYKEVLQGMTDNDIEKVWLWIFKNKQGQEVPQSWIIERIKQFKNTQPQQNQFETPTFSQITNLLQNRG